MGNRLGHIKAGKVAATGMPLATMKARVVCSTGRIASRAPKRSQPKGPQDVTVARAALGGERRIRLSDLLSRVLNDRTASLPMATECDSFSCYLTVCHAEGIAIGPQSNRFRSGERTRPDRKDDQGSARDSRSGDRPSGIELARQSVARVSLLLVEDGCPKR